MSVDTTDATFRTGDQEVACPLLHATEGSDAYDVSKLLKETGRGRARRDALSGVPLRCWDARSKVSDYLDDGLPVSDRVLVERHLEACPTCPPLYAALAGTRAALGVLRDADAVVPPVLADRIKGLLAYK